MTWVAPTKDANGWTKYYPSAVGESPSGLRTCIAYVSDSTGSNSNNGTSYTTPKKTILDTVTFTLNSAQSVPRGQAYQDSVTGQVFTTSRSTSSSTTLETFLNDTLPGSSGTLTKYVDTAHGWLDYGGPSPLTYTASSFLSGGYRVARSNGGGGATSGIGLPQWILLMRGDTFFNQSIEYATGSNTELYGPTAAEPVLISNYDPSILTTNYWGTYAEPDPYGTSLSRPIVSPRVSGSIISAQGGNSGNGWMFSGGNNVDVVGLFNTNFLSNPTYGWPSDGSVMYPRANGITLGSDTTGSAGDHFYVENCYFSYFNQGLNFSNFPPIIYRTAFTQCLVECYEGGTARPPLSPSTQWSLTTATYDSEATECILDKGQNWDIVSSNSVNISTHATNPAVVTWSNKFSHIDGVGVLFTPGNASIPTGAQYYIYDNDGSTFHISTFPVVTTDGVTTSGLTTVRDIGEFGFAVGERISGTNIPAATTLSATGVQCTSGTIAPTTYTNNGQTFTVSATIVGTNSLAAIGTGAPSASGTLTKASGTGDTPILFDSFTNPGGGSTYVFALHSNQNVTAAVLTIGGTITGDFQISTVSFISGSGVSGNPLILSVLSGNGHTAGSTFQLDVTSNVGSGTTLRQRNTVIMSAAATGSGTVAAITIKSGDPTNYAVNATGALTGITGYSLDFQAETVNHTVYLTAPDTNFFPETVFGRGHLFERTWITNGAGELQYRNGGVIDNCGWLRNMGGPAFGNQDPHGGRLIKFNNNVNLDMESVYERRPGSHIGSSGKFVCGMVGRYQTVDYTLGDAEYKNNITAHATLVTPSDGISAGDPNNGVQLFATIDNNIFYNYPCGSDASCLFTAPAGAIKTFGALTQGSGYSTVQTLPITNAFAESALHTGYVVLTIPGLRSISHFGEGGSHIYIEGIVDTVGNLGSRLNGNVFHVTQLDPGANNVLLDGITFGTSTVTLAAAKASYEWQAAAIRNNISGSPTNTVNACAGVIVDSTGKVVYVTENNRGAPGAGTAACGAGFAVNQDVADLSTPPSGSGWHVKVATLADGIWTKTNSKIDRLGTSGSVLSSAPDKNRTSGSYLAWLANNGHITGVSASATWTGSISAGVLTINAGTITGTVGKGDAIIWSGQTRQDYIKSFGTGSGGAGTYNLASADNPSNKSSAGAGTSMSAYTTQQLIDKALDNNKIGWNDYLIVSSHNDYIRQGFGESMVGSAYATFVGGVILDDTLADGTVGTTYSGQSVTASNGTAPYTYALTSGSLPTGLGPINTSTGAITGTPSVAGTYNFRITATDSAGSPASGSRDYTVVISAAGGGVTISTTSLPGGTVGVAYNQTISASGGTGPYTFAVTAGSIPTGLTPLTSGGVLAGTPTVAGSYSFSVTATDSLAATSSPQAYNVTISSAAPPSILMPQICM